MERLLAALGDPQRRAAAGDPCRRHQRQGLDLRLPARRLEAAGYRVHVYTSPHLVRFAERIRIAGKLIERRRALTRCSTRCERANAGAPISFFEITTALAFLAFARDAGRPGAARGRAGRPLRRHQRLRRAGGHRDHAGLARPSGVARRHGGARSPARRPASSSRAAGGGRAAARRGARAVIEARGRASSARRSSAHGAGLARRGRARPAGCVYRGRRGCSTCRRPACSGAHQYDNAGTALACLDCLAGLRVLGRGARRAAWRQVEWPARLQRLTRGPLADLLPRGRRAMARRRAQRRPAARRWRASRADWRDRPLHLVFGMLKTHDAGRASSRRSRRLSRASGGHDSGRAQRAARPRKSPPPRARARHRRRARADIAAAVAARRGARRRACSSAARSTSRAACLAENG